MATWQLPAELSSWIASLAAVLDARIEWRLRSMLVGLFFARGRRTITSWLRAIGVRRQYEDYYYFLGSLGHKCESVAGVLVRLILRQLPLPERVLFALDDTPTKRYGPKIEGAGIHHNPTPGPAGGKFLYGHNWVTLAAVVRHPHWGAIALPLLAHLYVRAKDIWLLQLLYGWKFRTKLQLAGAGARGSSPRSSAWLRGPGRAGDRIGDRGPDHLAVEAAEELGHPEAGKCWAPVRTARQGRRGRVKPVALEACRGERRVVGPDRSRVVAEGVVTRLVRSVGAHPPAGEERWAGERPPTDAARCSGTIPAHRQWPAFDASASATAVRTQGHRISSRSGCQKRSSKRRRTSSPPPPCRRPARRPHAAWRAPPPGGAPRPRTPGPRTARSADRRGGRGDRGSRPRSPSSPGAGARPGRGCGRSGSRRRRAAHRRASQGRSTAGQSRSTRLPSPPHARSSASVMSQSGVASTNRSSGRRGALRCVPSRRSGARGGSSPARRRATDSWAVAWPPARHLQRLDRQPREGRGRHWSEVIGRESQPTGR